MKTAVRRILLMSALMAPGSLYALGLGDIHLNSALNQPFDADIELVSATQEDLAALRAALAPGEAFSRAGLDRPAYLADFTFRIAKGPNGTDVLRVTSPRPVTEPFVTLLVEASWPRGRLLREYTVLLDPPVYAPAAVAEERPVVAPHASSTAAPAPSATPSTTATSPAAPRPAAAPAPSLQAGSTYKVRPNDTLWKIAASANPGPRSEVNRAMVAIYQKNTQAFEGNINLLKAGATLQLPQASEVQAISAAAASAEVARQYEMWRGGTPAAGQPEEAARLRLVTPAQGTAAPSTATTSAPAAQGNAPAPAAAPAATQAPATDVNARVQQLETELAEARRLLEVRNAELATLQGQAPAGAAPAEGAAPSPEAGAPPAAPEAASAPAAAEPAAPPTPAKKPNAAKPPAPEEPSLLDRVMNYWWVLAAALAALAGIALVRRMRSGEESTEVDLEEALSRDLRSTRPAAAASASRESSFLVEEKPQGEAAMAAAAARALEPARKPVSVADTLSGEEPTSIDAGDPLAEADFHMAYGLYDQAADLVQLAIKREPKRRDLKLKLLEIFFVWGNRDRFLETARDLHADGGASASDWDKVLIMGKQIAPDDALFAGAPRTSAGSLDMELHTTTGTIDVDVGAATGTTPEIDLTGEATDSGLDFVLDEPDRGAAEAGAVAPTIETAQLSPTVESPQLSPTVESPQLSPTVETRVPPTVKVAQLGQGGGDTEELPIESLGLELGAIESLDDLGKMDELFGDAPKAVVDDTIETPAASDRTAKMGPLDEDLLASTSLMKLSEQLTAGETAGATDKEETAIIDLSDATGELPVLESERLARSGGNYSLPDEAATMSEVGTKLDLARAYVDMGDPDGARSILAEVLQEGNAAQKQEAQRLMASLP